MTLVTSGKQCGCLSFFPSIDLLLFPPGRFPLSPLLFYHLVGLAIATSLSNAHSNPCVNASDSPIPCGSTAAVHALKPDQASVIKRFTVL
jgi:hypothetical protein